MKERPILMTEENAQKCHEGTKTQTRRIVSVPSWASGDDMLKLSIQRTATGIAYYEDGMPVKRLTCPYGVVGDRLWVRESIYIDHFDYLKGPLPKDRPALDDGMLIYRGAGTCCQQFGECDCAGKGAAWRPSIHMPRWACRTVLEITEVRVERLQDISDADALAEGVSVKPDDEIAARVAGPPETGARMEYFALWESIYGVGSWSLNPWVWVIAFKKVEVK